MGRRGLYTRREEVADRWTGADQVEGRREAF